MAILGSGPNRIGQGIEFDYSCVKACQHLKKRRGYQSDHDQFQSRNRLHRLRQFRSPLYFSPLYSEDLFRHSASMKNRKGMVDQFFRPDRASGFSQHIEQQFSKSQFYQFHFLGPSLRTHRIDRGSEIIW